MDRMSRENFAQQSFVHHEVADNAQPAEVRQRPVVEFLQDSKISVEYFKMKGSVFFSAIEKEDMDEIKKEALKKYPNNKRNSDESLRLFNLSAVNQDEFILDSVCVRK